MEEHRLSATLLVVALLASLRISSQIPSAPVEVHVPFAPIPVASNGSAHLFYELHVTNFHRDTGDVRLNKVEARASDDTVPIFSREGADLARLVIQPGAPPTAPDKLVIPAGMRAVICLHVTLPSGRPIPPSLRHRLVFRTEKHAEEVVDGVQVMIRMTQPAVFGPPLRTGIWFVANGPGNLPSDHWGGILAVNGRVTVPQRFALDLIGLDTNGRAVRGDFRASTNEDWVGYGAEVLAVADGVVREMHDDAPDKVPMAPVPKTETTVQASAGNSVVLDVGADTFVLYAHLQPRSVTVRRGDRVRRGQILGRLGNSGSTNAPHLHLHVADAAQMLEGAEGLPFVLESFEALGETTPDRALGADASAPSPKSSATSRMRELPLQGAVIRFH